MQQYLLQDLESGVVIRLRGRENSIQALMHDVLETLESAEDTHTKPFYFRTLKENAPDYHVSVEPFVDVRDRFE